MPRGISATVGAAAFKAALFYGLDKAERFVVTIAKGTFDGADDPAHLLWQALNRNRGKENAIDNYQRAVCAARAYCEGRRVRTLSRAKKDIFEWEPGLTPPAEIEDNVKTTLEQASRKPRE